MKEAIYLDADDTIWDVLPDGMGSKCLPPYKKVDDDLLIGHGSMGECAILLREGVRDLIDYAKSRNMDVVLVSQNDPAPVKVAIRELDLPFDREYISFDMNKYLTILRDMREHEVDHAYFVDDVYGNEKLVRGIKSLKFIKDRVELYDDVTKLIRKLER